MAKGIGRMLRDHAEAAELIGVWERSGEQMSTWCTARGINWYSMNAYRGRAGVRPYQSFVELTAEPALVEVVDIGAPTHGRYRIWLGEVALEVDDHFNEDTLRRLIGVVASC